MINELLGRVSGGENLAMSDMTQIVDQIMQGNCTDEQIGLLLTALHHKGETVDEIAGAAMGLRQHMTTIETDRRPLVDTCGTGGSGAGVFNVSTAAAIVAAAAGAIVAKHGNRKITSKTGSADVLSELGVNISAEPVIVQRCLNELGICFLYAPQMHPSMKHVAAVRKSLPFPTIFNMLGPLCNPAGADRQLLGVGRPELRAPMAAALAKLGIQRAFVVSGEDGLGEVTVGGDTLVSDVQSGEVSEQRWSPSDFGAEVSPRASLLADDPPASAQIIRKILAGEMGPPRDIVVANAAAALVLADSADSLSDGAQLARQAIDNGSAADLLLRLAAFSTGPSGRA